jgi:pterin-4a-carbinolamine dehydratase
MKFPYNHLKVLGSETIKPYVPSQLSQLHEEFIDQANRPMNFGSPITAKKPTPVIVPVEKWLTVGDPKRLVKRFEFRRPEDRNRFIVELMEYEDATQHYAQLTLEEGAVTIKLLTKDVDVVTEVDREYARFADSLFKDVVFSP